MYLAACVKPGMEAVVDAEWRCSCSGWEPRGNDDDAEPDRPPAPEAFKEHEP